MSAKPAIWRLQKGLDRRFRSGHPWVYSNELQGSPKGLEPGAPVELHDAGGKFLARGFGNPASLIAFRALSRDPDEAEPLSAEGLLKRLVMAGKLREQLGLRDVSHRLCFGEADRLPGLVIDRFATDGGKQVFVVQAHAAGMQRALSTVAEALERYVAKSGGPRWEETAIVVRNDVGVRKLEGLNEESPHVLREAKGLELSEARIRVASPMGGEPTLFYADLFEGQKTGFFLDQASNIRLAAQLLQGLKRDDGRGKLRVLDLCCYVGQWSTQLARAFATKGLKLEVVAVDASAQALELARKNIESQGASCDPIRADVLKDLGGLPDKAFDLVISDPPALIKGRKDIPTGTHAYLQLNTQVFRVARPGGAVISCSCSALLEEEEFLRAIAKAAIRNQADARWVGRGGQGPDHPVLAEFPEGRYLKGWIGFSL